MLNSYPAQISANNAGQLFRNFRQRSLKLGLVSLSAVVLLGAIAVNAEAAGPQMLTPATDSFPSRTGSPLQRAGFSADQGLQSFGRGNYAEAAEHWQSALLLYKAGGDLSGEGRMLENLSVIHRFNDEATEAIALSEQAITLYKNAGIADTQPSAYLNLGSAYRLAEQADKAIAAYRQGLNLYQGESDIQGERIMLSLLAQIYKDKSDYAQTIAYQQQALTLSRQIGNPAAEAEALSELGYAYVMSDQSAQAVSVLQPALAIYQRMGDSPAERFHQRAQTVAVLNNLGKAAALAEDYDLALRSYGAAQTIFQALNAVDQEAYLLVNIGQTQVAIGDEVGAIASYQQAVALSESLRQQSAAQLSPRLEAAYRNLAALLQQQDRMAEAQQILSLI